MRYDTNPYLDPKEAEKARLGKTKAQLATCQLSVLQENLLAAAKKNQVTYIQKNRYRYQPADFDMRDQQRNTPIYYAT